MGSAIAAPVTKGGDTVETIDGSDADLVASAGIRQVTVIGELTVRGGVGVVGDHRTEVEARLAARRASTITLIDELTRSLDDIIDAATAVATDDEHDPEGQTIAFERAQIASLLNQARSRLADLDAAARRLADGSYGRCERCARPIPSERLDVRPTATTCIACSSKGSK